MILILVIGIAITIWSNFDLTSLLPPYANMNISQPLGLFFTALLFLYLAVRLPKMVAAVVGQITSQFGQERVTTVAEGGAAIMSMPTVLAGDLATMRAATHVDPASAQLNQGFAASRSEAMMAAGSVPTATTVSISQAGLGGGMMQAAPSKKPGELSLGDASLMRKSISDATLKKMKKTFLEALREKAEKDAIQD